MQLFTASILLVFSMSCQAYLTSIKHSGAVFRPGRLPNPSVSSSLYETVASPDERYYTFMEAPLQTQSSVDKITLTRYLDDLVKENPDMQEMVSLIQGIKMASKTISNLVNRAGLGSSADQPRQDFTDGRYYSMQRLDQLSTIVLRNALKYTGKVEVAAPEKDSDSDQHRPGVLIAKSIDSNTFGVLDPLDGSGNADASICTGTLFGIFEEPDEKDSKQNQTTNSENSLGNILQPAKKMKAAGYTLYSSATVLVFTLGDTVQGFTLDPQTNDFILTHKDLTIPQRGSVYSCNEANSEGWQQEYKDYLMALKTGQGHSGKRYAHRYIGSMAGDIHRTLLYGGIFCYPPDTVSHPQGNLQLLYKIAPMAYIMQKAGGLGTNGQENLLDLIPETIHQKSPCYMGSPQDVQELQSYIGQRE